MSHHNIISTTLTNNVAPWVMLFLFILTLDRACAFDFSDEDLGYPFQTVYSETDHGRPLHLIGLTQTEDGILYVSSNERLYSFDGSFWRELNITNLRSLAQVITDSDGRLLAAVHNEFGYIDFDEKGGEVFHKLNSLLPGNVSFDETIWEIVPLQNFVAFRTLRHVLLWDRKEKVEVIHIDDSVLHVFEYADKVHISYQEGGVKIWDNGVLKNWKIEGVFAPGNPVILHFFYRGKLHVINFKDQIIRIDGQSSEKLLDCDVWFGTQYKRQVIPYGDEDTPYFLAPTWNNRLQLIDMSGDTPKIRSLNYSNAGADAELNGFYVDREGAIWLAYINRLIRLSMDLPLSYYKIPGRSSYKGFVRYHDELYAASNTLMVLKRSSDQSSATFQPVPWFTMSCEYLNVWGDYLFISSEYGFSIVRDGSQVYHNESIYPQNFLNSQSHPDRVYFFTDDARFSWLEFNGESWQLADESEVIRLPMRPYFMKEERTGVIWLEAGFSQVWRLDMTQASPELEVFTQDDGLSKHWININELSGDIVFTTREGILLFDQSTDRFSYTDRYDDLFINSKEDIERIGRLPEDQGLWITSPRGNGILTEDSNGQIQWNDSLFQIFSDSRIGTPYIEDDGSVLFRYRELLVNFSPGAKSSQAPKNDRTWIRKVITNREEEIVSGNRRKLLDEPVVIPYAQRNILFQFASTVYDRPDSVRFQHWLEGYMNTWSGWQKENIREFTNLPPGDYVMHLQARYQNGPDLGGDSFKFSILVPWYRTVTAYLVYFVLTAGLMGLIIIWNTSTLKRLNRELSETAEDRGREIVRINADLKESNDELIQTNERLSEANHRLEEMAHEKDEFIGIVSHDLRNPVGRILNTIQVLKMKSPEEPVKSVEKHADIIESAAAESLEILTHLLDINRIEQGEINASSESLRPGEILELVIGEFRESAERKGLGIEYENGVENAEIMADPVILKQIIENLLSNAVKFSSTGAVIKCGVSRQQNTGIRINVCDEGPGIPVEERDQLFKKFPRINTLSTGGESSTGLGLAIVRKLTEAMGGSVHFEPNIPRGSVFSVEFPAQ